MIPALVRVGSRSSVWGRANHYVGHLGMVRPADYLRVGLRTLVVAFVLFIPAAVWVSTSLAQPVGDIRVIPGPGIDAGGGTMPGALTLAYQRNSQLNAQRAAARATDENVPTALAGYRPKVSGTASVTEQYIDNVLKTNAATGAPVYVQSKGAAVQSSFGLTATQTLYNGFQNGNRTRQAESQVFAARETLRSMEQTVLLEAATAYMNLLRDAAILELQRSNVNVLEVTLRQTRDRFTAGEVTRTDVAQAESRLSGGRSQLSLAESNYVTSRANFRQVIGVDPPARLAAASPVDRFFPRTVDGAVARGNNENPNITSSMYLVDVAVLQVKVAEGSLYPTVAAVGAVTKNYGGSAISLAAPETLAALVAG